MNNMILQTADRAFEILEMIAQYPMTQKEIQEKTGLNRTTLSRIIYTLENRKYIEKNLFDGKYKVGLKVVELGSLTLNSIELKTEALPYLRELSQSIGRVCHMGILSQGEVVYIEKIEPITSIRMFSGIGKRVPVHSTSLGKALLIDKSDTEIERIINEKGLNAFTKGTITTIVDFIKEMAKVKAMGYAFDNEENEVGIFCAAAPIRDYRGDVIAAISTAGKDNDFIDNPQSFILKAVIHTAKVISEKMGYKEI